jgi:flavin-dependent dehydrogenase
MREQEKAVNSTRNTVENLVIGGGPGGSMLAMRLAAAGREVVLLEKERDAHHKVCGEFLSREAVAYLAQAGIEPRQLGAATIERVRVTSAKRTIDAPLPFTALSLSRFALDEGLLQQAANAGCEVRRGAIAERLERTNVGWSVQVRDAKTILAKTTFLATGKHDLRAWERRGGAQTDLVGFKMHWRLSPAQTDAVRGAMELFLFRGGYGGLSLVENDVANLCLVVQRKHLASLGGWTGLLPAMCDEIALLRGRLAHASQCWPKPLAISPIPYGYLSPAGDGLWRLGDQAAVIPSFTGDGMSIALHSGSLAAEMHLAGRTAEEFTHCLADQLRRGMKLASILSQVMVTSVGRAVAPVLFTPWPHAIGQIASLTRIPDRALVHTLRASA